MLRLTRSYSTKRRICGPGARITGLLVVFFKKRVNPLPGKQGTISHLKLIAMKIEQFINILHEYRAINQWLGNEGFSDPADRRELTMHFQWVMWLEDIHQRLQEIGSALDDKKMGL